MVGLATRPGTLWTSAALNWWLVLVGKESSAFTVSRAKSGAARTEGTGATAEASSSGVGLQEPWSSSSGCLLPLRSRKKTPPFCPLTADRVVKSLAQVYPVYKGEDGQAGGSQNCYGRNGNTTFVQVSLCVRGRRSSSPFIFTVDLLLL